MKISKAEKQTLSSSVIKITSVKHPTDVCDSQLKSMLCLTVARAKNEENQGSFDSVLCSLQQLNNVPKFQLGDVSMPKKLF